MFDIEELENNVWISAFDTKPHNLDELLNALHERMPDVTTQIVDLEKVAGSRYLLLATFNALKSFGSKQPIARSLGMEMLLYIAATRQIQDAIIRVGVDDDTRRVIAVVVGKSKQRVLGAVETLRQFLKENEMDELVDRWDRARIENVRSRYGIGNKELKAITRKNEAVASAVQRLAIERSAMLTIKK